MLQPHLRASRGPAVRCEAMANLPDWLWTRLRPFRQGCPDEHWLSVDSTELLHHRQRLDLRRSVLTRLIRYQDRQGRRTHVEQHILLSLDDPALALMRMRITAENWHGALQIES
ncbi:hypothetical protein [Streptomyces sp. NPDC018610]|uniref:hypothetical protein n=1 Tax=Streptomyces sp. NPDC018610 TaxID=3365049 RepID=UPI003792E465